MVAVELPMAKQNSNITKKHLKVMDNLVVA
jgi:hypothetical protein